MVNFSSPYSQSAMDFLHQPWMHDNEPSLRREARQYLLDRRDKLGGLHWVWTSDGAIPKNAFSSGGRGSRKFYIGRAQHQGSVTPGKVDPSGKGCCIPWGGAEHCKKIYEVLCTSGEFRPVDPATTEVLLNAASAGISEQGEPLFIGRVLHNGTWINGKVQRSHGVCYIAISGKEVAFREYEVFVADSPKNINRHYWKSNTEDHIPHNITPGARNENGQLYVGRAYHRHVLIPGTVNINTMKCHIIYGSNEIEKEQFEYLCNSGGKFVPGKGKKIPMGAIRGGFTEYGEPLFIGRVKVGSKILIGKVQPSLGRCFVPSQKNEVGFEKYEILVEDLY